MGAASIPAHFSQAYGPPVAKRQRTLTEIHMNDHDYPTNNTSNHVEENRSTATDETKMLLPTPVGSGSGVSSRWTAQPVLEWVELIAAATESADHGGPLCIGDVVLSEKSNPTFASQQQKHESTVTAPKRFIHHHQEFLPDIVTSSPLSKNDLQYYMMTWLRNNWINPYPDDEDLIDMARHSGTTTKVISNWLDNARTRKWRPAIQQAYDLNRPPHMLLEDSLNIFDGYPIREVPLPKSEHSPTSIGNDALVDSEHSPTSIVDSVFVHLFDADMVDSEHSPTSIGNDDDVVDSVFADLFDADMVNVLNFAFEEIDGQAYELVNDSAFTTKGIF